MNKADQIVEKTADKVLEYLTLGVPAVSANGEPLMTTNEDGEVIPVRKAPGAGDIRAALAVAKECDARASKNGNTLGGKIKDAIANVHARKLRIAGEQSEVA